MEQFPLKSWKVPGGQTEQIVPPAGEEDSVLQGVQVDNPEVAAIKLIGHKVQLADPGAAKDPAGQIEQVEFDPSDEE